MRSASVAGGVCSAIGVPPWVNMPTILLPRRCSWNLNLHVSETGIELLARQAVHAKENSHDFHTVRYRTELRPRHICKFAFGASSETVGLPFSCLHDTKSSERPNAPRKTSLMAGFSFFSA